MSKWFLRLATCWLLSSVVITADAYAVGDIAWQRNFNKAKELAKQTGKPMLLDFTAEWCGPCKKMEAEVWNQPEIVAAAAKFVPVAVDIDSDSGTAGRYNANPIPLIVVTDPWGNVLNRNSGYMSAHRLSKMLAPVPADFSPVAEQMATLARNEKNAPALVRVGEFYVNIGALDMGNVYFERALKTDAAKTDEKLRGNLLIAIGLNHWRLGAFKEAQKNFEKYLTEAPNGEKCDQAMLGVILCQIKRDKLADTEKTLAQLQAKYPDSNATKQAVKEVAKARAAKPK